MHALHVTDLWLSDHYTGTGEQREIVLADGSRAFLNTDSALSLEYTESLRQVRLHRGQVLFTVAPRGRPPLRGDRGRRAGAGFGGGFRDL
ncbi:MAG: FecR domain-containing protein [Gammaproteobacteria bacterium]